MYKRIPKKVGIRLYRSGYDVYSSLTSRSTHNLCFKPEVYGVTTRSIDSLLSLFTYYLRKDDIYFTSLGKVLYEL